MEHFFRQHTRLEERLAAARVLGGKLAELAELDGGPPLRLFADTMSDAASLDFGALPERLVILSRDSGTDEVAVSFIGGKGPESYSVTDAAAALAAMLA